MSIGSKDRKMFIISMGVIHFLLVTLSSGYDVHSYSLYRRPKDILCLILFVGFIIGMFSIGIYSEWVGLIHVLSTLNFILCL